MISFLHLFPQQLGLNGETGNLDCLQSRLLWAGQKSTSHHFHGNAQLPNEVDAVFIGSGTLSGALEALELMRPVAEELRKLAAEGVPFFALGLGWEILGQEIQLEAGTKIQGLGIYPSRSRRVSKRASCEAFGFDSFGKLTAGYANHSSEIELLDVAKPLIELVAGFGNNSLKSAPGASAEGLLDGNLWAARLNGPLFPLNPHLADEFLSQIAKRSGFDYQQLSDEAREVDELALNARTAIQKRLLR